MENQWKDIRAAYKRVVYNAFDNDNQRDAANVTLLKLGASLIDLALSGDTTLKNATRALFGESRSTDEHIYNRETSREPEPTNNATNVLNTPQLPNDFPELPGLSNMQNIPNLNQMFTLADSLFNRGNSNSTTSFISNEEIRNLFPLWNMFDSTSSNTQTTNIPTTSNDAPPAGNNDHTDRTPQPSNE